MKAGSTACKRICLLLFFFVFLQKVWGRKTLPRKAGTNYNSGLPPSPLERYLLITVRVPHSCVSKDVNKLGCYHYFRNAAKSPQIFLAREKFAEYFCCYRSFFLGDTLGTDGKAGNICTQRIYSCLQF